MEPFWVLDRCVVMEKSEKSEVDTFLLEDAVDASDVKVETRQAQTHLLNIEP
jgi:hypothetical protein